MLIIGSAFEGGYIDPNALAALEEPTLLPPGKFGHFSMIECGL